MRQGIRTNKQDNSIVLHIVEKRFGKNVTTGALIGRNVDGHLLIGWSRVNVKANDKFDNEKAWLYASHNLLMGNPVPETMQNEYLKFVERCTRYFKGAKLSKVEHVIHDATYRANILRKSCNLVAKEEKDYALNAEVSEAVTKLIQTKFPTLSKEIGKGEIHLFTK